MNHSSFQHSKDILRSPGAAAAACLGTVFLGIPSFAFNMDFVPVGNAGNANDPKTGNLYGGVAYGYNIGKYEVTIGQ
jgi:hypothetical protein